MIRLSRPQIHAIQDHGERTYPYECCGLLSGIQGQGGTLTVTRVTPSPNVAITEQDHGAQDRFEVDPQIRLDLMRSLRAASDDRGEVIVGHYHSHPDHPAQPSDRDLDMAFEPDLVWLIVSVTKGHHQDARTWRLNRDTRAITPIKLVII